MSYFMDMARVLVLEPWYGGCNKKLIKVLLKKIPRDQYTLITMPPKIWTWRSKTSAIYMAREIPENHGYKIIFCSSVLPLAELIGLRPDLAPLFKLVYFHENHLEIPEYDSSEHHYQIGYKEVMTCLAADQVLFNSNYNKTSFLKEVDRHMQEHVDYMIQDCASEIEKKSEVVYFPLNLSVMDVFINNIKKFPTTELQIIWPQRSELDRLPEMFYSVIRRLNSEGFEFKVIMIPQQFTKKPMSFYEVIQQVSASRLVQFQNAEGRIMAYYTILKRADVILSTSRCEFFGHQILEGIYFNLTPVLPRIPIFQEFFGNDMPEMYDNETELYNILADLCRLKKEGIEINRNYRDLITKFESNKWFEDMQEVLACNLIV